VAKCSPANKEERKLKIGVWPNFSFNKRFYIENLSGHFMKDLSTCLKSADNFRFFRISKYFRLFTEKLISSLIGKCLSNFRPQNPIKETMHYKILLIKTWLDISCPSNNLRRRTLSKNFVKITVTPLYPNVRGTYVRMWVVLFYEASWFC
jgi:hypothetical protein